MARQSRQGIPNGRRSDDASREPRVRKSLMLAAVLQGIPLIGASGCITNGLADQRSVGFASLLWLSVLLWGFGYLYVGQLARFTIVFLVGPALAFASCVASFKGVTYDYEHGNARNSGHQTTDANRASIQTGLLVAIAVMILAVDSARLAAARNDEIDDASASHEHSHTGDDASG